MTERRSILISLQNVTKLYKMLTVSKNDDYLKTSALCLQFVANKRGANISEYEIIESLYQPFMIYSYVIHGSPP